MIPMASGVRVWIATGHTDMRRGMNSLTLTVQEALRRDPHTAATSTCSAARATNTRHSAYSLRSATIAYPWHPLFGRTLQVAPFRSGKDLKCICTEEQRGFSREVPNWMFDESYCAGMALGSRRLVLRGLTNLSLF
jgi:IS66 Orf2 like protein